MYQHEPASKANPKRQEGPHAHSINVDAGNQFAFAADLGCDRVFIYKLDAAQGKITPNTPAFGTVPAGGGPRHFAFHPNGKYAYVCNEMTCTVTAFEYDAARGALTEKDTVSTLPEASPLTRSSPLLRPRCIPAASLPMCPTVATTPSRCMPWTRPAAS
ncbi:lactonase family protein [Verrucomicrobium spinosum]|uniref:lactonase family protein n=1 Tax=Verrucomicrobium spinosum TaxID=2736 RepID=UPI0031B57EF3